MFSADSFCIALRAFILLHHDIYLTGLPVLWMFGRFHNLIYILCPISSSVILSFPSAQQCFLVSMSSVVAPFCCCCFPVSVTASVWIPRTKSLPVLTPAVVSGLALTLATVSVMLIAVTAASAWLPALVLDEVVESVLAKLLYSSLTSSSFGATESLYCKSRFSSRILSYLVRNLPLEMQKKKKLSC